MEVKRGDIVLVAAKGGYGGKPRPAVVVQSDLFNPTHGSVTLCLCTSELRDAPLFRISVEPNATNGLTRPTQVMVDKILSAKRSSLGAKAGELDRDTLRKIDQALRLWLGL